MTPAAPIATVPAPRHPHEPDAPGALRAPIGEATARAATSTGPGIGALLNASFGNAPELIIALIAISNGLAGVVRALLAGSVVGNLLLVLGFVLLVARSGTTDRTSAFLALAAVLAILSWTIDPLALRFRPIELAA